MEEETQKAILSYLSFFRFNSQVLNFEDLFQAEVLVEMAELLGKDKSDLQRIHVDIFNDDSVASGFKAVLKAVVNHFSDQFKLVVSLKELGVNVVDMVQRKDQNQLFTIIKLLIGIIIEEQNQEYINFMMEMDEEEAGIMQEIGEQVLNMKGQFNSVSSSNKKSSFELFDDSPELGANTELVDQQYIDKIDELNMQIEGLHMEKHSMRAELLNEK